LLFRLYSLVLLHKKARTQAGSEKQRRLSPAPPAPDLRDCGRWSRAFGVCRAGYRGGGLHGVAGAKGGGAAARTDGGREGDRAQVAALGGGGLGPHHLVDKSCVVLE